MVSRVLRLPAGEQLPRRVAALTGLSESALRSGEEPVVAWDALAADAAAVHGVVPTAAGDAVPTVVHFARFETPFLDELSRERRPPRPLDVVCTHEVARRLLPELPRRTLRALAGYFGHPVARLRRSAEHVHATALIWKHLVVLLAQREGIDDWPALRQWLCGSVRRPKRRVYPMPTAVRLAVSERPGVYRMLRVDGTVLYVGKARSLRARVNSYFRHQSGGHERTLEMLSQARALSVTETESPLEAALLEPDEIKHHRPSYNVALVDEGRDLWFASRDLSAWSPHAGRRHLRGPFRSRELLEAFDALARRLAGVGTTDAARILGTPERWTPPAEVFAGGWRLFLDAHAEARRGGTQSLLVLGARLWRQGWREEERDDDASESEGSTRTIRSWEPPQVAHALERVVVRMAHAVRRAQWMSRLADCALCWNEPLMVAPARIVVLEAGVVALRRDAAADEGAPEPASCRRPTAAALDVATFDRLRVLTTELKRLVSEGRVVDLRFAGGARLNGERLRRALAWV